jgi:hypothetical protein
MKTTVMLAIVVCALLAFWGGARLWSPATNTHPAVDPLPAPPSSTVGHAAPAGPAAGSTARAPLPRFSAPSAAPVADLPSCEKELESLRHERDDGEQAVVTARVSSFEQMQPSPRNQRILAPMIERVLSGFNPRPEYTLECRVSRCLITLLSPDGGRTDPWIKAIQGDEELSKKLQEGGALGWAVSSRKVKDALSGKDTVHTQLFCTVPARRTGRSHPFDVGEELPEAAAPWSLTTCRGRVATLRKQLAIRQEEVATAAAAAGDPEALSRKNFAAARRNPELGGRFQSVVAALVQSGALPATATTECRGESDCLLSFFGQTKNPAGNRQEQEALMEQLGQLLKAQGYSYESSQVSKRIKETSRGDARPASNVIDTAILLRLRRSPP